MLTQKCGLNLQTIIRPIDHSVKKGNWIKEFFHLEAGNY